MQHGHDRVPRRSATPSSSRATNTGTPLCECGEDRVVQQDELRPRSSSSRASWLGPERESRRGSREASARGAAASERCTTRPRRHSASASRVAWSRTPQVGLSEMPTTASRDAGPPRLPSDAGCGRSRATTPPSHRGSPPCRRRRSPGPARRRSPVGSTRPRRSEPISSFMPVSSLTITGTPAGQRLGGRVGEAVLVGRVRRRAARRAGGAADRRGRPDPRVGRRGAFDEPPHAARFPAADQHEAQVVVRQAARTRRSAAAHPCARRGCRCRRRRTCRERRGALAGVEARVGRQRKQAQALLGEPLLGEATPGCSSRTRRCPRRGAYSARLRRSRCVAHGRSIGVLPVGAFVLANHVPHVRVGRHEPQRADPGRLRRAELGERGAVEGDQVIGGVQRAVRRRRRSRTLTAHIRHAGEKRASRRTVPLSRASRAAAGASPPRRPSRFADDLGWRRPRRSSASTISCRWRPRPPAPYGAGQETTTRPAGIASSWAVIRCARQRSARGVGAPCSDSRGSGGTVVAPEGHEVTAQVLAERRDLRGVAARAARASQPHRRAPERA